jgi:IS5 family transposase
VAENGRRLPTRYRGLARTQLAGYLVASAYNLVRIARLLAQPIAA